MSKEWAWSYSKKKNFDNCPRKFNEIDLLKKYSEESEQLKWGNTVHKSLAAAILHASGIPSSGSGRDMVVAAPLPASMASYQRWVDEMKDIPGRPGKLYVEQKYSITRDFQATSWFAPNTWYRGICDVVRIDGPVALARDWKTGKVVHDSIQLMLMAQCLFIHHPELKKIKTEFVWLQDDCTTPEWWDRTTIGNEWHTLLPEIKMMEQVCKSGDFQPKPSGLCVKWCPVKTCEFHGRGNKRT